MHRRNRRETYFCPLRYWQLAQNKTAAAISTSLPGRPLGSPSFFSFGISDFWLSPLSCVVISLGNTPGAIFRHDILEDDRKHDVVLQTYRVDPDFQTTSLHLCRQHLVQVHHSTLASIVSWMSLGNAHKPGNGRDVDDCRRPAVGAVSCSLEQWNEPHGHKVRTVDVGLVCVHPVGIGNVGVHVLLEFGGVLAFGLGLAGSNSTKEECIS